MRATKSPSQRDDRSFLKASRAWENGELRSAFRLFLLGAKAGDPACQVNLGHFYDEGIGVRRQEQKAILWWRRAYRAGDAAGAANIGVVMRNANRTREAIQWFTRAMAMGDDDSALELAKVYLATGKRASVSPLLRRVTGSAAATPASREDARRLLRRLEQTSRTSR